MNILESLGRDQLMILNFFIFKIIQEYYLRILPVTKITQIISFGNQQIKKNIHSKP